LVLGRRSRRLQTVDVFSDTVVQSIRKYTPAMFSHPSRNPSAASAMKRAVILNAVFVTGLMAPPCGPATRGTSRRASGRNLRPDATECHNSSLLIKDLKTAGLWPEVEQKERDLLLAEQVSERQRINASWLAESITCLLWALGMIPELPAYDQEADASFIGRLGSIPQLVPRATLRPKKEIEKQRQIAELWHWRARTQRLQEQECSDGAPAGVPPIEEIIKNIAGRSARLGLLPRPIAADFPALGKPYRDLSSADFATLSSISQERHRAFNWLCGFSPTGRWADTRTDT
jgi:hypothetical protein